MGCVRRDEGKTEAYATTQVAHPTQRATESRDEGITAHGATQNRQERKTENRTK